MALWAIELSEFDVQYRPRIAVKGQIVADFIAEYTQSEDKGAEGQRLWSIHTDGSLNQRSGGVGVVIQTLEGDKIECMIRLDFPTTNNEAEYEALVAGLDLAKAVDAENMIMHCDSQVITSQINGDYECRNERMKKYLDEVKSRISGHKVKFVQIPREENECIDRLAKTASTEFMNASEQVLSFVQTSSLIDDEKQMQEIAVEENWTMPLIAYLQSGTLPDGKETESPSLAICANQGCLIQERFLLTIPKVFEPQ